MIRVAIVDDEPFAREGLRLRLSRESDVEIVGEAGTGEAAIDLVAREHPDLLLLDVQMPGLDGFQTLACMADVHLPLVVFVTAYDRYAVRAFEAHALDYLMKPVDDARLAEALQRARRALVAGAEAAEPARVAGLIAALEAASPAAPPGAPVPLSRFLVRERGRFRLLPVDDVRWIEAAANYVELHTAGGSHLVRMTLAETEARLSGQGFSRIHRGLLVRA